MLRNVEVGKGGCRVACKQFHPSNTTSITALLVNNCTCEQTGFDNLVNKLCPLLLTYQCKSV